MFSPFVYWGQTSNLLTLRVDLKKAENPLVELTDDKLSFSGCGYGARGQSQYLFHIDFFNGIDAKKSTYKVIDRDILFVLRKKESTIWPRLLEQTIKPPWLKVDFDKMEMEDFTDHDSQDDLDDRNDGYYDSNIDSWKKKANLFRDITRNRGDTSENTSRRSNRKSLSPEELRKVYFFLYNLFQCVGCAYILLILVIACAKSSKKEVLTGLYSLLSPVIKVLQLLKILEMIHPILSFTSGDLYYPAITFTYRLSVMYLLIEPFETIQSRPVVRNILMIWSISDIIRYSHYMMQTFKVKTFLTWLYQKSWMLLYPVEFLCTGVLIIFVLPLFDETGSLSIHLPNPAGISS